MARRSKPIHPNRSLVLVPKPEEPKDRWGNSCGKYRAEYVEQARTLCEEQCSGRCPRLADEQGAAVPDVRTGSGCRVEDTARCMPHVGLVRLRLHLQLFHRIERRDKCDQAASGGHGIRNSIHHEFVVAGLRATAAVDAELSLRIAGVGSVTAIHTWGEPRQVDADIAKQV